MSSRGSSAYEPANVLQRPTSARTQDVSHLLSRHFGDIFMRDIVDPQTLDNLRVSQGSDDPYHEYYVQALLKVTSERQRRLDLCTKLEKSLIQAKARAMSADERELNRVKARTEANVEIPAINSHLRSCLDNDLLRSNGLICPQDLTTSEPPPVPMPISRKESLYRLKSGSTSRPTTAWTNDEMHKGKRDVVSGLHSAGSSQAGCESECDWPADPANESIVIPPPGRMSSKRPRSTGFQQPTREIKKEWQRQVTEEDRERDRKTLTNLQYKVDFLKNPRFTLPYDPEGTGTLLEPPKRLRTLLPLAQIPSIPRSQGIFIAIPSTIRFTEYEIGSVYELTLELQNISTTFRGVRIIPPKTKYFSVGLGQFPGEGGVVASGMSCKYTIRFCPDSRGDFIDEVVVETQDKDNPIIVPLIGQQPRPVLTVPQVWNLGEALVFGSKIVRYEVKNKGGKAKFVILSRDAWPTTNFKTAVTSDTLVMPPFLIRPSLFELAHNQSIFVEVVFMPVGLESYTQDFIILCDNCHVKTFQLQGIGELASVDLVAVEGDLSETLPGEMSDVTAQHLLRLEDIHPYTYSQRKISVRNNCHVDLPYSWKVIKPHCPPPQLPNEPAEVEPPRNRTLDVDAAFSIESDSGSLKADSTTEFTISFAPTSVSKYHSVLHLVLQGIPDMVEMSNESTQIEPICREESHLMKKQESNDANSVSTNSTRDVGLNDITGLEIEMKGSSVPLDVLIEPRAVLVAGKILMGTTIRRQIKVSNRSHCPVTFLWESPNIGCIVEVEPQMGMIPEGQQGLVDVCITGSLPGALDQVLLCHVENMDTPISVTVEAVVKGPQLTVDQPGLDFGLIRLGDTAVLPLLISNQCPIPANWTIHMNDENSETISEFRMSPVKGALQPLGNTSIEVQYTPTRPKKLRGVLEVHVENGTTSCVNVTATVQNPQVCLLECQLNLTDLYVGITSSYTIQLCNQTELATSFKWCEMLGSDGTHLDAVVEPAFGYLGARDTVPLTVRLTPKIVTKITDFFLSCTVVGMDDPVVLAVQGHVQGPRVTFQTVPSVQENSAEGNDSLLLDFGSTVPLGKVESRRLLIRNETAIPANFSLTVEAFPAVPPTEEDPIEAAKKVGKPVQGGNSLLCRTANLADPKSKPLKLSHYDYCKAILGHGQGAAFLCIPPCGKLEAFEECSVDVQAFSDMWGEYHDEIVCKLTDLPESRIPLTFGVVGVPLEFSMTGGRSDHKANVRFGTRTNGSQPVTRKVRLNNKSPFDLRLDWELYIDDHESDKLIDMCLTFGQPFPRRNSQGDEIVPVLRHNEFPAEDSMFIPDSIDTSALPSRQLTQLRDALLMNDVQPCTDQSEEAKLISLIVRPHDGVPSKIPFSISPGQLTIPAEAFAFIEATFTPDLAPGEELDEELGCLLTGYALGFVSVDPQPSSSFEAKNPVKRAQAYEVEQVRLDFTGKIDAPKLQVDYYEDEDEGFEFECVFSDLLATDDPSLFTSTPSQQLILPQAIKRCSAVLRNCKETATTLDLHTALPFVIVKPSGGPRSSGIDNHVTTVEALTLQPRESCTVELGYVLNPSLLDAVSSPSFISTDISLPLRVAPEEDREGLTVHCRDALTLAFSNGTRQLLPCHASVVHPRLILSGSEANFGTCFIGQTREIQLLLVNPTKSHSLWTVVLNEQTPNCADGIFNITPPSGYLKETMAKLSADRSLIKIFFTPSHPEHYEAKYTIEGVLGEAPQIFTVSGFGSYDEQYQEVYNI